MKDQTLWIVLPNDRNRLTGALRLSIFIAPKLYPSPSATLAHYQDFLDWPARVNALLPFADPGQTLPSKRASLEIRNGGDLKFELKRTSDDSGSDKCSSAMWRALFTEQTVVTAFGETTVPTVRSYPVRSASNHLKRHYLKMLQMTAQGASTVTAECPHAPLPRLEDLRKLDTLSEVAIYRPARPFYAVETQVTDRAITGRSRASDDESERRIARSLRRLAQHPSVQLTQQAIDGLVQVERRMLKQKSSPAAAFADQRDEDSSLSAYIQLLLMQRRRTRTRTKQNLPPAVEAPCDFHSSLSFIGEYPWLMRRLCLVLDFEVSGDISRLPPEGCARLLLPESSPADNTPWTAYTWDASKQQFRSLSADPNYIKGGMLNLSDTGMYAVERLDVEGAAIKTVHFQDAIDRAKTHKTADTPESMAPPSLRSAGFAVVQKARGARLVQHLSNIGCKCANLAAGEVVFCAEDLARGLRVDVWDKVSSKWHSLCRRRGRYIFDKLKCDEHKGNTFEPRIEPEGFVTPTLTRPVGEPSESASIPEDDQLHEALFRWQGWSLSAPRPGNGVSTSASLQSRQRCDLGLQVSFEAEPGSLPALRFRKDYKYKFRARVVDLAGNSLALEDVGEKESYEIPDGDGIEYQRFEPIPSPAMVLTESLNPAGSPGELLERLVIRTGLQDNDRCQRLVVPPRGTGVLAELCGNLDSSRAGIARPKPEAYDTLTDYDSDFDADTDSNDPNNLTHSGNPLYRHYEFKHGKTPDRSFRSPYLPDPASYGATISFHDYFENEIPYKALFNDVSTVSGKNSFNFYYDGNSWPDVRPFLVRLGDGSDRTRCSWDFSLDGKVLQVALPPGEILKVRLSSNPSGGADAEGADGQTFKHGLMEWLQESEQASSENLPTFSVAQRNYLTAAILSGKHSFVTPYREVTLVHAVQKPLIIPQFTTHFWAARSIGSNVAVLSDDPIVVDGHSTVKLDVLASWNEPVDDESLPKWETVSRDAHVCEIPVSYGDAGASLRYNHDLNPSGTKYRRISYQLSATSRFKEYFRQAGTTQQTFSVEGPKATIEILSTARPDVVKSPYLVPTFEWQRETGSGGSATTSVRKGGGLRVYFDRPWFSSGDGELLGVVLCSSQVFEECMSQETAGKGVKLGGRADLPDPDEAKKPYVTQWGVDPIWSTNELPDLPGQEHFENVREFRRGLSLAELPDDPEDPDAVKHRFCVAAFDVHYDCHRRLWYADIVMNSRRSYYPFIRLALARYQPNSVFDIDGQGCHLSQVVLADFMQLCPDRWATVSRAANDASVLHITVYGATPASVVKIPKCSEKPLVPTYVTASLERAIEHHEQEKDLSWVVCGTGDYESVPACSDNQQTEKVLPLKSFNDGISLWSDEISLPKDWRRAKYRVVIREYEQFCADGNDRRDIDKTSVGKRLVYAEVLQL
jgi:hypothetical protein